MYRIGILVKQLSKTHETNETDNHWIIKFDCGSILFNKKPTHVFIDGSGLPISRVEILYRSREYLKKTNRVYDLINITNTLRKEISPYIENMFLTLGNDFKEHLLSNDTYLVYQRVYEVQLNTAFSFICSNLLGIVWNSVEGKTLAKLYTTRQLEELCVRFGVPLPTNNGSKFYRTLIIKNLKGAGLL